MQQRLVDVRPYQAWLQCHDEIMVKRLSGISKASRVPYITLWRIRAGHVDTIRAGTAAALDRLMRERGDE